MIPGSAEKTVPLVCQRTRFGAGFSKLAMARSAPLISSRIAPPLPVRLVTGCSQPNAEQQVWPVISAVPPSNGKSTPLPLTRTVWYTPRSRRMSPPANIVHVARRIEGRVGGSRRELGVQPPLLRGGDAVHAEQRPATPGQRPNGRRHRVGAQEGQALAVLREVLGERGRVGDEDQAVGVGRSARIEGREDRVRLPFDQDERLVARARAGEHVGHLVARGVGRDGTELRDRHDRDVGQWGRRRGGRRGGRGFGCRARIRGRRRLRARREACRSRPPMGSVRRRSRAVPDSPRRTPASRRSSARRSRARCRPQDHEQGKPFHRGGL